MSPISLNSQSSTTPLKTNMNSQSPAHTSSTLYHAGAQPMAVSSSGMYFTLSTGQQILDAVSGGAAVAALGNGNEEVIEAMTAQAKRMSYAYHQSLSNGPADELAAFLCAKSEGNLVAAAFLNSGSEAMEAAIKLSRQYWVEKGELERKYIIARNPSYHGNTMGALAVGYVKSRRDMYEPLLSLAFHHVTSPTYKRSHNPGESEETYSARLASELDSKILELGPQNVIGFFAEPVVGAALGVMPPPKGYFPAIDAVVKRHGILLVMDEVMSGSGRCGELFAHQAVGEGVKPDIVAMAKGLGSGYVTISGILVNQKVADVVREGGQWKNSHTYQGHPVNCAVALKVMEIIEREQLMINVRQRGKQLVEELQEGFKDEKVIYDVRGKGLFVGVDYDVPSTLKPRFAIRVKDQAMKNGLLTLGLTGTMDGIEGDTTILAPAYNVTSEQISDLVRLLVKSVKECVTDL